MKTVCVKCPAKINLTLEVVNKREDGFHNINSVMQLISLYDFLNITVAPCFKTSIELSGNSDEIPYNEKNLVYKAADLFVKKTGLSNYQINIYIDKNIPIAAGLAGGSTDGAGTLYGLNTIFGNPLNHTELHDLAAQLGSDLNVCLEGGCLHATLRGENIRKLPVIDMPVSLIKPQRLGISAKEAYTKYSAQENKPNFGMTDKLINALNSNGNVRDFLYNDLEGAVFNDYKELQTIKSEFPNAVMSGSGPTFFVLENIGITNLPLQDYMLINGLKFIKTGVEIVKEN